MACCGQTQPNTELPSVIGDTENLLARPIAEFTPSIYKFRAADDEMLFQSTDLNLLLAQVIQYRHENKLPPIKYLKEVAIDFTMRSNDEYAPYTTYYQTNQEVHTSAKEHVLGALAYMKAKTILSDEELFVDQPLAEKRALTCLNCPRHVPLLNGHTVNSPSLAQSRFAQLAKGKTTSVDNALHICGICTCLCRAKVHFKLPFIKSASSARLIQEFKQKYIGQNGKDHMCWIGAELIQEEQNKAQEKLNAK